MPTYLLHGFKWLRTSIIVHIIQHNLEEAAADWLMAPATSISLLNSFYSTYDFLPPSHSPLSLSSSAESSPARPRTSTKNVKKPTTDLRNGSRSDKPSTLVNPRAGRVLGREMEVMEGKGRSPEFNEWSAVKLVEQYDVDDLEILSQPYAYVADYMMEIKLGASISEELEKYQAKTKSEEPEGDLASPRVSPREWRRKSRRLGWLERLRDELEKEADIGWYVVVCGDLERVAPEVQREESGSEEETPKEGGLIGFLGRKLQRMRSDEE
jgi:hypothetical protein